jgi:hypothetical protein
MYVLPSDGRYWRCASHEIISEPGEHVLEEEPTDNLIWPSADCRRYALMFADKEHGSDKYEIERSIV